MNDVQTINASEVGRLEDVLGPNDPLFRPNYDAKFEKWWAANCGNMLFGREYDCRSAFMAGVVAGTTPPPPSGQE